MLDATPLGCHIIDKNHNIIDCNEAAVKLYGFKDKQEYIERWLHDCSPEYQPDGQRSDEKMFMFLRKAMDEGSCVFEWLHQMPDGTPLPAEITHVRVEYEDSFIVAGYTRDLRAIKKLEEKAEEIYYDPLTGIYNRRYFQENMHRILQTLSRSDGILSLMMIDIDHFKRYNDTYGHSEGDNCLRIIAGTLSKSITRDTDFVARYGGEEFVIVLPHTDEDGACKIAEKLLENIRDCNIPHTNSDVADCVTISIGVTTGKAIYTQSSDDYVKRADEMLYKSKQSGRNRSTFAQL
jgi:diguanylate cyclase (GGDEF)-like protein